MNCIGDLDARLYVVNYTFTTGNTLVSWKIILQPMVMLSTIQVEYMDFVEATKEET